MLLRLADIQPGDPAATCPRCLPTQLARYFGTSQRFWMNLQTRYDLEIEKDRLGAVLDEIHPLSTAN